MRAIRGLCIAATGLVTLGACGDRHPGHLVGTLERDRIEIVAEDAEPILSLRVREGQHVAQGEVLIEQDTTTSAARIAQADAQIEEARNHLSELEHGERIETIDQARARVAAAKAALTRDEKAFGRVRQLIGQHLISASELDAARTARDASDAALREAQAQLTAFLRGTRVEEVDQARAALAAAEAARHELEAGNARLIVRATRSGTIDALPFKAGERPPKGAPMVVMLADTPSFARVYVPQGRRMQVRAGLPAKVFVDGLDQALQGRVRYISSDAAFTPYFALTQRDRSRLSFLCEIEITDSAARPLPAGIPVEAEIDYSHG